MMYLTRRLLGLIPVFFGITVITFFVTQLAPGDPTDLQTQLNPKMSPEAKEKLSTFKPDTLARASRISGITPADITVIQIHMKKTLPPERLSDGAIDRTK